tara:strand:- start:7 stop:225 length:219 start_codon:yes stop_codon:yes gene_type:complete
MSWRIAYTDSREEFGSDVVGESRLETFDDVLDHLFSEHEFVEWRPYPDTSMYNYKITDAYDVTIAFVYYQYD